MSLCNEMLSPWELRQEYDRLTKENDTLRARVAELEEALEQIAGCEPYMVGEWVIILARAALKEGESNG